LLLSAVLAAGLLAASGGAGAAPGDADLALTKSDSPDPVTAGDNLTYTIKVQNPGMLPATETKVTDKLPAGVDFISATGGVCERAGDTVTCDLGQVNAASTATVTIIVKTKKAGTLSNTASVASPDDLVPQNNSATATTTVSKPAAKPKKPKKPKRGRPSCGAPTISGTAGNDTVAGTSRGDVIVTFGGNDQVFAGGGSDLVCSGPGADLVAGQDGGDTIIGGGGADRLIGGKSGDVLKGKNGRDRLKGKSGDDFLNGGKKRDRCKGGSGRDTLVRCP
ncbi:MAG TPA: hypothetical protein VI035_03960, partial [Solirubrobacterales bacterium]